MDVRIYSLGYLFLDLCPTKSLQLAIEEKVLFNSQAICSKTTLMYNMSVTLYINYMYTEPGRPHVPTPTLAGHSWLPLPDLDSNIITHVSNLQHYDE